MLTAYMNPLRMLKGYKHATPNAEREIELVASVEEMIGEGRPVPVELRTLAGRCFAGGPIYVATRVAGKDEL